MLGSLRDEVELSAARRADIVVSGFRIAPLSASASS